MLSQRIEKLKQQYTGRYVVVDGKRPGLARFAGISGVVKTVNMTGRALVQFEGADQGWYDLELDDLKVIDKPQPKPAQAASAPADAEKSQPPPESQDKQRLSRLELARLEKEAQEAAQKPKSTGDRPTLD